MDLDLELELGLELGVLEHRRLLCRPVPVCGQQLDWQPSVGSRGLRVASVYLGITRYRLPPWLSYQLGQYPLQTAKTK